MPDPQQPNSLDALAAQHGAAVASSDPLDALASQYGAGPVQSNVTPLHPEATMTADHPIANPNSVTLGDVMANPSAAMQKIGTLVKQDLSDPKLWAGAALAYFGPKMAGAIMPRLGAAAEAAGGVGGMTKDAATLALGASRVNAAQRLFNVGSALLKSPEKPTPMAEGYQRYMPNASGPPSAVSYTPSSPSVEPTVAPGYDRYMPNVSAAPSDQPFIKAVTASTPLKFSAAETSQGMKWMAQGVPQEEIVKRIMESRALTAAMKLKTPDEVNAIIAARNK